MSREETTALRDEPIFIFDRGRQCRLIPSFVFQFFVCYFPITRSLSARCTLDLNSRLYHHVVLSCHWKHHQKGLSFWYTLCPCTRIGCGVLDRGGQRCFESPDNGDHPVSLTGYQAWGVLSHWVWHVLRRVSLRQLEHHNFTRCPWCKPINGGLFEFHHRRVIVFDCRWYWIFIVGHLVVATIRLEVAPQTSQMFWWYCLRKFSLGWSMLSQGGFGCYF